EADALGRAPFLDARPVPGPEELLPGDVDAGREVADVAESLLDEPRADLAREARVNAAAIDERRLAPRVRGLQAEEEEVPRPARLMRALVVEEDLPVGGVGRRAVDLRFHPFARQVPVVREERRARRLREAGELGGSRERTRAPRARCSADVEAG